MEELIFRNAKSLNNKMPNIEPPNQMTAEPTSEERYTAAFLILFDKKPEYRQIEIEAREDNRWNRVFAKEVVEMAESEDEGISKEIDSFVVSLRLLQDVANNVPDIVPAYLRLEEEKEDKSKKPPANPINFK